MVGSKKTNSHLVRCACVLAFVILLDSPGICQSPAPGSASGQQSPSPQIREQTTSSSLKEKESSSIKERDASSVKERESKEAKEIKEIKDQPSTEVGLAQALAWPIAVVLIASAFFFSSVGRRMLGLFPKVVRKISFGAVGVEMEISQEAADEVRNFLRGSFEELLERADEEYRRMAAAFRIFDLLGEVLEPALSGVLAQRGMPRPANLRGTVYVPDIVFQRCLYQFVNYYPQNRTNGPAGRRFSQRFGIIGRSWRLEESMGRGNTLHGAVNSQRELIEYWGMTREEVATQSRSRPSDLCVILRSPEEGNLAVGLLFVDTTELNGLGSDNVATGVAISLETAPETRELAKALGRAMAPLRLAGPQLEITRTF